MVLHAPRCWPRPTSWLLGPECDDPPVVPGGTHECHTPNTSMLSWPIASVAIHDVWTDSLKVDKAFGTEHCDAAH